MALDVELGAGINLVFSTPILIRRMSDADTINKPLREAILRAEAQDHGVHVSNIGGWQSKPTFLQWPVPEIATLRAWIDDAVAHISRLPFSEPVPVEYSADAWVNVNRNGNYNKVHNHGKVHWALVYYVDCGRPLSGNPMNGRIELRDPRAIASGGGDFRYPGYTFGHGILIEPQPGMLLAFPAWLEHFVHPFFGEGERISIAINIVIRKVGEVQPQ